MEHERTIGPLITGLPISLRPGGRLSTEQARGLPLRGLTEDSRQVQAGWLFAARPGTRVDGRAYIAAAVEQGAAAVLTDDPDSVPAEIIALTAEDVPLMTARLAERWHGDPSQALKLIGITGTNGKTTTAHLVHQLLNGADVRCGLIGTVHIDDGRGVTPAELTTPPAMVISSLLRRMVDAGCRACVMEVSSHALEQRRVAGLAFDVCVFTNLSGDHLDYHGSMERYAAAKARLFEMLNESGRAIINLDDPASDEMTRPCRAAIEGCSLRRNETAAWSAEVVEARADGATVRMRFPVGPDTNECTLDLPLIGRHNVMNALQAAAAAQACGLSSGIITQGLRACSAPPGRLEPASTAADDITVLVDYAHTDDALDNALTSLRPLIRPGARLSVVFGCGGDRDRTKRPRMAAVAAHRADRLIITSDNPRTEDPAAIVEEVRQGVPAERRGDTRAIVDRREAIMQAISTAQPHDIVLIAGKGHEDYQIIGTTKRPFDDRAVAREALASRRGAPAICAAPVGGAR